MASSSFDEDLVFEAISGMVDVLNEKTLTTVEAMYAISAVLRGLGESIYDKEDVSHDIVFRDYRDSPSLAAALILIADLPAELLELYATERDNPEINEEVWNKFGEEINDQD